MSPQPEMPERYQLDPDSDLPPSLLQLFLRAAPKQLAELLDCFLRRDINASSAQAHKLKGGLYAAGASRLAESLEVLRSTLSSKNWATAESQLRDIEREFGALIAELERRLAESRA